MTIILDLLSNGVSLEKLIIASESLSFDPPRNWEILITLLSLSNWINLKSGWEPESKDLQDEHSLQYSNKFEDLVHKIDLEISLAK